LIPQIITSEYSTKWVCGTVITFSQVLKDQLVLYKIVYTKANGVSDISKFTEQQTAKLITELILEKKMRWVLLTLCTLANSKQLSDVPLALNFDLTTI
jgi:hypothetical protein